MINTIDLHEKDIIEEKTRKQIIQILVEKAWLDRSFASKKFENLDWSELEYLFLTFEKNYNQIRNYLKNEWKPFPTDFEDFKKIPLWKCKRNIREYKFDLLNILAKTKKSEFLKYINPEKFLYITSESSDWIRNYILSRTYNLENLAKSLNKLNNNQIKALWFIIRNIDNQKKILNFIKATDTKLWICLDNDPETISFFLKTLEEKNSKLFFDINTYGDNHLKTAENCYYKEKMVDLIMFLECQIFLYKAQEIDPKTFAKLIDRSIIKWLWQRLVSKEWLNWRKNTDDIKELIHQINEESLSKKSKQ